MSVMSTVMTTVMTTVVASVVVAVAEDDGRRVMVVPVPNNNRSTARETHW